VGKEVERQATRFNSEDAETHVSRAFVDVSGSAPNPLVGIYALALAWVESGAGASAYNWNVGGTTCYPGKDPNWNGDWFRPSWWYDDISTEEIAGRPTAFRAYSSADDGWRDFVRTFWARPSLVYAANADDPSEFVRQLVATGYSSDYSDAHVKTFTQLTDDFKQGGFFGYEAGGSNTTESDDDASSSADDDSSLPPQQTSTSSSKPPTQKPAKKGSNTGLVVVGTIVGSAALIWLLRRAIHHGA
jgi:hypothetical protein